MLILPEKYRYRLSVPFGSLFPDFSTLVPVIRGKNFCTVGDVVTNNAVLAGLVPAISVIDGVTRREVAVEDICESNRVYSVDNAAGTISDQLIDTLNNAYHHIPARVMVHGEEDLAVLPLISLLPDGWMVIYGQPHEGAVLCMVDSNLRQKVQEILMLFESR